MSTQSESMACPPLPAAASFMSSAWMLWLALLAWPESEPVCRSPHHSMRFLLPLAAFFTSSRAGCRPLRRKSLLFLRRSARARCRAMARRAASPPLHWATPRFAAAVGATPFWRVFRFYAFWMIYCFYPPDRTIVVFCNVVWVHWVVMWLWCIDEVMFAARGPVRSSKN